jgi:signal transduction histidine kinase
MTVSAITDPERRLHELAAANLAVGSEPSLQDVLQKAVDAAARLVDARHAALRVLDTGAPIERLVTTKMDEHTEAQIGLRTGHGLPRLADMTKERPFLVSPSGHPSMQTFLGVPIFVRGVVYADLYLAEKNGGEFTEGDKEIVTLFAAQTGITIEKVQIHEGATHWIRQLETLDVVTRSVLEERDLARLLELVACRLRQLVGARAVLISLPAPSGGLRVAVADGDVSADVIGYDIPSGTKHPRVFARRQSERVDALLADPEIDQVLAGRVGAVTALLIPLVFQEKALGVISAFNNDGPDLRFTDDDVRLGEAFGARAALAVHLSERVARETVDAILQAQEAERSRIARELHDETGSALTAVLLGLAAIDGAATLPEVRQASAGLRTNASSALEEIGRLAFALRPRTLDEFGLAPALKDLSRRLEERGGPKVAVEIDLPPGARLPEKLETAMFRVTQEALTNIVKHAAAETVRIILAWRERSILLAIEDDGRGFSAARTPGAGYGLVGMRERVASLNGALEIESTPAAGTRIAVEIPLS